MGKHGAYAAALNAPFSEQALGAQIPDIFSYPTDTRHFRSSFTVSTNNVGAAEIILYPSPVFSIASPIQVINGGYAKPIVTGGQVLDTCSNYNTGIAPSVSGGSTTANTMDVRCCVTAAQLSGLYTQYRVVGWGYKIRALGNFSTTAGRVQVASIPAPRFMPNQGLIEKGGATWHTNWGQYDAYAALFGTAGFANRTNVIDGYPLASPTSFAGNILNYPVSVEATCVQLQQSSLKGIGKLASREFESWRNVQGLLRGEIEADAPNITVIASNPGDPIAYSVNQIPAMVVDGVNYTTLNPISSLIQVSNGNGVAGVNTYVTGALASGMLDANSCLGWNCVLIAAAGLGQNETGVLEVEIIYHIEGIPALAIGTGSTSSMVGLGGLCSHHSPIEAMAAETINGAAGKNNLTITLT